MIGIGVFYMSCNKDQELTDTNISTNTDIIDFNKIKMPRFNTVNEFKNTIETVKNLEGQDYLDWEKQYGFKTIYGDYVRASMEMDTITSWNSYLKFRDKWEGKVKFPVERNDLISCLPRYFGYISKTQTKIMNDNLGYEIQGKYYLIFDNKIIIFRKAYKIPISTLKMIVSSKKKINQYDYDIFPKFVNSGKLTLRFNDENSPIDHSPFINDPIPAAGFCEDDYNPDGYLCRHRLMRSHLTNIFVLYIFEISNNTYEMAIEQDYWVDFYRKIGYGWYHNDVDLIEMGGNITGKTYLVFQDNYQEYLGDIDMHFDDYAEDADRLATGIINVYGFSLKEGNTITGVIFYIDDNKRAWYSGTERLGDYCDNEHVELECTIPYPSN